MSEVLDVFRNPPGEEGSSPALVAQSRALAAPGTAWPHGLGNEAFRAIVVPNDPTGRGVYTLSGLDFLEVVSVSATVDTSGAGAATAVAYELWDQSGIRFAINQTGATLATGLQGEVTFASYLPDSSTFPTPISPDFIQSGMPIILLSPGTQIVVRATDPGAIVTQARIWAWDATVGMTDLSIPPATRLPAAA